MASLLRKSLVQKEPGETTGAGREPGSEDFTPRAVNRAVLLETIQHPLTILPAAAAAVSGLYMALISFDVTSFTVGFASSLLSVGAWVFNYFIRGESFARRHVARLGEQRRYLRVESMRSLEEECEAVGFADGSSQARELREAYHTLEAYLQDQAARSGGAGMQRLLLLAEDTYREAVALVRKALQIYRALEAIDIAKLRQELAGWQQEQELLRQGGAGADDPRLASLESRIDAHQRTMQAFADRHGSVDRLLAESEQLESTLRATYLEMVDLSGSDMVMAGGDAAGALERAVEAARRVEDRLRAAEQGGDGIGDADDGIYLEAGRTAAGQ